MKARFIQLLLNIIMRYNKKSDQGNQATKISVKNFKWNVCSLNNESQAGNRSHCNIFIFRNYFQGSSPANNMQNPGKEESMASLLSIYGLSLISVHPCTLKVFQELRSKDGEGNGIPLQYSCLENPMDGGACRLQSMGSHRVGHDWNDLAAAAAAT